MALRYGAAHLSDLGSELETGLASGGDLRGLSQAQVLAYGYNEGATDMRAYLMGHGLDHSSYVFNIAAPYRWGQRLLRYHR